MREGWRVRRGWPTGRPLVAVVALAMLVTVATLGPGPQPPPRPAPAAAPDPPSFRLGYVSADRPALAAAVPGGVATSVLGAGSGDADSDADARAGALAWISRRAAPGGADADGDVFVLRSGGAPTRLTDDAATDRHPALSPDGRRVAFTSDRGGGNDLWVVDVAGGPPRRLTDHPADDSWPTWSPDGQRLAFSSTRDDAAGDIYTMPATGGPAVRLTTTPGADIQPAWSPDGRLLAFTTARFGGGVEVVTMPAAGGPVTRAVPRPFDAAQPAFAPDSRRLAFVSTRADPAGDVLVVDAGRVTAVAASAGRAESEPTWRGTQVVHTSVAAGPGTDVWSADADGGDRRDLTGRPALVENGPAFAPDGLRLAYSAGQPDGGQRIVVADADGRNPRVIAPTGTLATDRDTDPTWSPDGTMLAFARRAASDGGDDPALAAVPPGRSRVLVVRVADAVQVGELPLPSHVDGDDAQPAWAPSGDRIAVSRLSGPRPPSRVDPPRVDRPLLPGRTFEQPTTVLTDEIPARPDIVFFIDSTASMTAVINTVKQTVGDIVDRVQDVQPDARFAVIAYGAHEPGEIDAGRYYRRLADLTGDADALRAAMGPPGQPPLVAEGGGEEGWYNALFQAFAGGDQQRVSLRPGASPIAVLIGDAPSTGNTRFPGGGEVTQQQVIEVMNADPVRAKLVAVPVQGAGEAGLNVDDPADADSTGEATEIADATDGTVTDTATPAEVTTAIIDGIAGTRVSVVPGVERCDGGLSVAFDPPRATVESGARAGFTERVSVAAGVAPGTVLRCTVLFDIGSPVPLDEVRQEIIVPVPAPDVPFVRVDDVTAVATGPAGAPVSYQASAITPDGRPMRASCAPPSGSVFPIGQTVVTCTASAFGRTGQDTATITVVEQNRTAARRIWVARIAAATADQVRFGDQHDISARVAAPCQARGRGTGDTAPAWSPDSARLAFIDSAGPLAGLCVVDPDGTDPATPVAPADQAGQDLADPAWAPDGTRIAVARQGAQQPPTLITVPSAGGPASVVVRTEGGAGQPAYQPLPARDLTVTVSVAGQPGFVGGDDLPVTFTVRNDSPRPASNVFLSPVLPATLLPAVRVDGRCDAGATVCRLGTLDVGDQVTVTLALPARAALSATVSGQATATVGDRVPITRLAAATVLVRQPTLTVDPPIGPPGFVTRAVGAGFPPGATVRLRWETGITAAPDTVRVGPDGTFTAPVLVLRKDRLGPRLLRAQLVTGPGFAAVQAGQPFLVVPRQLDPPNFDARR